MLTFKRHMVRISRWGNDRKLSVISIYASKSCHPLVHIKFDMTTLIQFYVLYEARKIILFTAFYSKSIFDPRQLKFAYPL